MGGHPGGPLAHQIADAHDPRIGGREDDRVGMGRSLANHAEQGHHGGQLPGQEQEGGRHPAELGLTGGQDTGQGLG